MKTVGKLFSLPRALMFFPTKDAAKTAHTRGGLHGLYPWPGTMPEGVVGPNMPSAMAAFWNVALGMRSVSFLPPNTLLMILCDEGMQWQVLTNTGEVGWVNRAGGGWDNE